MVGFREYLGGWADFVSRNETSRIMGWLKTVDRGKLNPEPRDIFKAFTILPCEDCKVIWLADGPVAHGGNGLAFGKKPSGGFSSPSLGIIKAALAEAGRGQGKGVFDDSMETLSRQGILLLNTALTCEVGKPGSHDDAWRPFISRFLERLSLNNRGLIYVMFGEKARSFIPCVRNSYKVTCLRHPDYYVKRNEKMPCEDFVELRKDMLAYFGKKIYYE